MDMAWKHTHDEYNNIIIIIHAALKHAHINNTHTVKAPLVLLDALFRGQKQQNKKKEYTNKYCCFFLLLLVFFSVYIHFFGFPFSLLPREQRRYCIRIHAATTLQVREKKRNKKKRELKKKKKLQVGHEFMVQKCRAAAK